MNNKPYAGISHELSPQAFNKAMLEAVDFVDAKGWDAPPTLFGLVPTSLIKLAHDVLDDAPLTLVVQELPNNLPPESEELSDYISRVTWPDGVVGAILAQEIRFLDPNADASTPPRPARLFSGVLRDDMAQLTLLQLRLSETDPQSPNHRELRGGPGVASGVIAALQATFE
jgi:hypothetical protein